MDTNSPDQSLSTPVQEIADETDRVHTSRADEIDWLWSKYLAASLTEPQIHRMVELILAESAQSIG
ncbi:hypothetical protein [Rhodanobacter sp. L36]|uniref:hypothetical protein n=1 Tax=Rhodanobacter sp. L36 TaxID=1747221 RepID=UPI00131BF20E|nr:hypothetical protein [Rhodanobacter sp. L36]